MNIANAEVMKKSYISPKDGVKTLMMTKNHLESFYNNTSSSPGLELSGLVYNFTGQH